MPRLDADDPTVDDGTVTRSPEGQLP